MSIRSCYTELLEYRHTEIDEYIVIVKVDSNNDSPKKVIYIKGQNEDSGYRQVISRVLYIKKLKIDSFCLNIEVEFIRQYSIYKNREYK